MKLTPLNNNIIIKQDDNSEQKHGNIIIADTGKELPRTGTVIAVGSGMVTISGVTIPCQCKVGDKVAFPSFGGTKMTLEGEEFVVLKDTDILTIIE